MSQVSFPQKTDERAVPTGLAGEAPGHLKRLTQLWNIPATRALVALLFVVVIGCLFNAHGAFFKAGTHRDALQIGRAHV